MSAAVGGVVRSADVARDVARFHLDSAAYALACAVVDERVWTLDGMVTPDSEALAAEFRQRRAAWVEARWARETDEAAQRVGGAA